MGTITFRDGTKRHIAKKKRRRYQPILKELKERCPYMDHKELEIAAYVMAKAGLNLIETFANPEFEDALDYYLPEESDERIVGKIASLPISKGPLKSQYTREQQRDFIKKYLEQLETLDSRVFYMWYRFKRSRDLILKMLEELGDLELIQDWRIIDLLKVDRPNEPWSRRRKEIAERLKGLVPKTFIYNHPEFGYRPGDDYVRRVYDAICDTYYHNKKYEGQL